MVRQVAFLGQPADDERIPVPDCGRGRGFALADGRIALAVAGHAGDLGEHVRGDEAVVADPRGDLQGHPDIDVLHLLLDGVDAGQGDGGQDRQGVAGDDLGRRSALGGDPRLGDDPPVALGDLGVDGGLQVDVDAAGAGRIGDIGIVAAGEGVGHRAHLVVGVVEVQPDIAGARLGQFDEHGLEHHAVDGDVQLGDLLLQLVHTGGRALQDDGVQPAIDADGVVHRLAHGIGRHRPGIDASIEGRRGDAAAAI